MGRTAEELNEENSEVILRMAESGDDLSRPRDIKFAVVFPSNASAAEFASHLRQLGYAALVERTDSAPGLPWDVKIVKHMLPVCEAITDFELLLQVKASPLGGRNDGWGCLEQNGSKLH
jgi:hypothetical protein